MSRSPLDLNHLKYFQAIARSGSMSAAARLLHVSQPALTQAVRHLEERLGTTLFVRDRSGASLTRSGEVLLRHADDVFTLLDRAERDVTGVETDDAGSFVIGCHESLGSYFLPSFMAEFLQASPRIELTLWNATSAEVERAVVLRTVHFGLVVNARPSAGAVAVELLHDAVDVFVASDLTA